jgi:hypothetical protein
MTETPTDPLEELYLHIFIGSMVLIRDFYGQFGAAYSEPAEPEAELSVHFMGFFIHVVDTLAPNKQLPEQVAPHIAEKIADELDKYGQEDIVTVKQGLIDTAAFYASQPTQATSLGALPVDALVTHICETVMNTNSEYKTYTEDRVRSILETAVPFKQLVEALS